MLRETIADIEARIRAIDAISAEKRDELLTLLRELKGEVNELSKTDAEHAESIAGFVRVSTHEAMRQEKNPQLVRLSIDGLASTVKDFELSHPRLVEHVNAVCSWLASVGI